MQLIRNLESFITPDFFDTFIYKLMLSFVTIISLWFVNQILRLIIKRNIKSVEKLHSVKKFTRYFIYIVGIFVIGQVWFQGVKSLGTFLGLFTAGLAIALKDVVTNCAGWFYLLWQSPFKIGDRIQIKDHQGDVIDIGLFKFTILEIGNWVDANQSTGRMIRIPNADIFNMPIANYSKGFNYIWYEIPIILTYESDWRKGKELFINLISEYAKSYEQQINQEMKSVKNDYPINYRYTTPTIYTSTLDHGISLTLRYMVPTRAIRQSTHDIWEAVLDIIDAHDDLDLAYPTHRLLTQHEPVKS